MSEHHHRFDRLVPEVETKIDELLSHMTLTEKVGQLVIKNAFGSPDWDAIQEMKRLADERGEPFDIRPHPNQETEALIRQGRVSAILSDVGSINNHLQRIAKEESRLHIPLLIGADVIHGFRTTFPVPIAEACTWNPELLERAARVAAAEVSATGVNWIYAPMVDVARDPRWGRIAEGAGEDPFLGRALAVARVRGFQAKDLPAGKMISSCPKHYAAYGGAEGGRDYNTVDISERTLRDVHLPPFKAAFEAGAGSTMCSFNEIGGQPVTGSPFMLRTILREEWGFLGVVVSDYNSIGELVQHGVAEDLRDAARLAILAGVDIDLDSGAYLNHLEELVEGGSVPLALVDEAVRRVLRLKIRLGLFENPYVDEGSYDQVILTPAAKALALEVAQQSMVLLKNEAGLLPLAAGQQKIALIGPLADNRAELIGSWGSAGRPADVETVLEGFNHYLAGDALVTAPGCSLTGSEGLDFHAAVEAARRSDVVVAVVGENAGLTGEAHSLVHLRLPGRQQALLDVLAQTGKPLVIVLMCGRPMVIPQLAGQAGALLVAWHGGVRAGRAIADLLFGAANPSGCLTASWPRHEGQIPVYYAHKATGRPIEGSGTTQFSEPFRSHYLDEPNSPLFAFGEGMSYTTFEFSQLEVLTPSLPVDGVLSVQAQVENTGPLAGAKVVQLYVRDLVGSVTRPTKELKGFARLWLEPGEHRQVRFDVPAAELGFHGPDLIYIVEPGKFKVWIAPSSVGGLEGQFEIHG